MQHVLCLAAMLAASGAARSSSFPSDDEIRDLLRRRVEAIGGSDAGIGIVVGIFEPRGRRIVAFGHPARGDSRPLTGDSVFEIGSVGKVFTALLLADMVDRGHVALADPVAKWLPPHLKVPKRGDRFITLADLATHTSGLPFMTDERPALNAVLPYSGMALEQFLSRYALPRDPGASWDYSNVGYWLLGEALTTRGGMRYDELLQTRVLAPLKLRSTATALTPRLRSQLAVGHDAVLQPALPPDAISIYSAMGPAIGMGVVSTANDLSTLLAVAMGYERSPLAASMAAMLNTRRPMGGNEQALGWIVTGKGGEQVILHEGGTWGSVSAVAWDPRARIGVVVLSNQLSSVTDIALHLLRPAVPVDRPPAMIHKEIVLDPAALDACAGRYDLEDEGVVTVRRKGDFLTLELPVSWGLPEFRLRPESRQGFFVAELPIRATFQWGEGGHASGMLVYPPRGQRALPARRIEP